MPEPISTALSFCIGIAALNGYRRSDTSISPEARFAITQASNVIDFAEHSQALFGARSKAITELMEMVEDYRQENDGVAIEAKTVQNVQDFIRALPDGVPMPEFGPEPDGSISLDWIRSRYRMFSISVGVESRIAYAWIDGSSKGHAVANFDGMTVPSMVLSGILPITDHGQPSLKAA